MKPVEMTLSSPNYPKYYNADGLGCEWLITAPEGFVIALEFNHFHVSNLLYHIKDYNNNLQNLIMAHISYMMLRAHILYQPMMEFVIKPNH